MALESAAVKAAISAEDVRTVAGFGDVTFEPSATYGAAINTTTYNTVRTYNATLAANASVTLDLYSNTPEAGGGSTHNTAKVQSIFVKATLANTSNTGGMLKIESGAVNGAPLWFGAAAQNLTLTPTAARGVCVLLSDGSHAALNTTTRNCTLSNPGTNTIIVTFEAILGT